MYLLDTKQYHLKFLLLIITMLTIYIELGLFYYETYISLHLHFLNKKI